jgi:cell wall-associated NlpC family hydrolase
VNRSSTPAGAALTGCGMLLLAVVGAPLLLVAGCQATETPIAVPVQDLAGGVSDSFGDLDSAAVPDPGWVPWLQRAGQLCTEIPASLIAAQIDTESHWKQDARSEAGAVGLAQFTPDAWADIGQDDDGNGTASPDDPGDAIMAQGRYMCRLVDQASAAIADGRLAGQDSVSIALASYNTSFDTVLASSGVPPLESTQAYVRNIVAAAVGTYSLPVRVSTVSRASGSGGPQTVFGAAILTAATRYLGFPYVWGGGTLSGPSGIDSSDGRGPGFDCSGLVAYAVYSATEGAVELPRVSRDQGRPGPHMTPIPLGQAAPGDIIAFKFDDRNGGGPTDWDHIGIISGPDQMFHAPQSGEDIGYADLSRPFYAAAPHQVFRVVP